MSMNIGNTIRRLRREHDITQEQLAEYLGITSRSVSQWECGKTSPDISQLPILANIFEVSADELLGIDIRRKNDEIESIIKQARELGNNAEWQNEVEYIRAGLLKYPSSHKLMKQLADALVGDYSRRGIKDYSEVYTLCERIITEADDINLRNEALRLLAGAYGYAGDTENMMKTAERMPSAYSSREAFLMWHNKGNAGLQRNKECLSFLLGELADVLSLIAMSMDDNNRFIYDIDDRILIQKQIVDIIDTVFPDGDYQMISQNADIAFAWISSMYFKKGDIDSFFLWLDRHCDFTISMDSYDFDSVHTSPALRDYSDGGWIREDGNIRSADNLESLINHSEYLGLHDDPRFINAVNRLKQYK